MRAEYCGVLSEAEKQTVAMRMQDTESIADSAVGRSQDSGELGQNPDRP